MSRCAPEYRSAFAPFLGSQGVAVFVHNALRLCVGGWGVGSTVIIYLIFVVVEEEESITAHIGLQ